MARRIVEGWSVGLEHYAETGNVRRPHFGRISGQATYLALDWTHGKWAVNFGVGHGWTASADKLVVKAIVGTTF